MQVCLYDPSQGYYSRNAEQFGKAGDFYTSSDVHAVYGRLLARQFDEMWRALDRPAQIETLELGPGRGLFARDVLDWCNKKFPDFFAALTYTMQESSPALRAKLQDTLEHHLASGKAVASQESPEERPTIHRSLAPGTPLIVFANEFFDALPVEILGTAGKLHIALENNRLHEVWLPPPDEELEFLDRYGVHPEAGERIEVPMLAQSASPDPYEAPGEQDLTTHVNFTALAGACEQAGMQVEKLLTQSQFLMGIGERNQFADAFEDCRVPQERAKVALQLKHLVTPVGMGENFRVLMASRAVNPRKIAALSGLRFGGSSQLSAISSQ